MEVVMDNGQCKGKKGNWITIAEWDNSKPIFVKTKKIDGKILKEDIWYTLKDGKFTEVK
jgi:hypothetical protein